MSEYLIKLTNRDDSIIIQEHEDTEQTGDKAKTDYRYIGADPNNYVCLEVDGICEDNELYRIIGVIPTQSSDEGDYENRVKLVKYISYENNYWSGSAENKTNDWKESTLNIEVLNRTYWNQISAYHQYIAPAKWYLGKISRANFVNTFSKERVGIDNIVTNVGLIYASDYGYATSGIDTEGRNKCLEDVIFTNWCNEYSYCNQNNWLYQKMATPNAWLIGTGSNSVWEIIQEFNGSNGVRHGGLNDVYSYDNKRPVYPSFYLKSTVKYLSGTGTKDNPYRITVD